VGFLQASKFLQPEEFFFHSPHKPFGFGIALGIVIDGIDLLNIQSSGHLQEGTGTRLAAIVAHQFQLLTPHPVQEGAVGAAGLAHGASREILFP
jgi:hypothetical protein